jgi:hypothetical protein
MNLELHNAVKPLLDCEVPPRQQRMALHQMFALAVANIPDNETDNFTAKNLMPVYLALCEVLENVQEIN